MVVNRLRGVGPAGQQYAEISGVHDVSENSPPATSPAKSHSTSPKKVKEGAAGVLCSSLKDATTEQSIVAALSAVRAYIEDGTACARLMSAGLEVVLFEKVTAAPHPRKVCRAVSGVLLAIAAARRGDLLQSFLTLCVERLRAEDGSEPTAQCAAVLFTLAFTTSQMHMGTEAVAESVSFFIAELQTAKPLTALLQLYRRQLMQERDDIEEECQPPLSASPMSLVQRLRANRASGGRSDSLEREDDVLGTPVVLPDPTAKSVERETHLSPTSPVSFGSAQLSFDTSPDTKKLGVAHTAPSLNLTEKASVSPRLSSISPGKRGLSKPHLTKRGGSFRRSKEDESQMTTADSTPIHSSSMLRLISHSSSLCVKKQSVYKKIPATPDGSSPLMPRQETIQTFDEPDEELTMPQTTLVHLAHKMGQIYATKDAPALLKRMRRLGLKREGNAPKVENPVRSSTVELHSCKKTDAELCKKHTAHLCDEGYKAATESPSSDSLIDVVRLSALTLMDVIVGADASESSKCVDIALHELDTYFYSQSSQDLRSSTNRTCGDPSMIFRVEPYKKLACNVNIDDDDESDPLAATSPMLVSPRLGSLRKRPRKQEMGKCGAFLLQSIINRSSSIPLVCTSPTPPSPLRNAMLPHADPFLYRWSQVVGSVLYRGGGTSEKKLSVLAKYFVLLNRYVEAGPQEGLLLAFSAEVVMEVVMDVVKESQGCDSFMLPNIQLMLQCVRYVTALLRAVNKPASLVLFLKHLITTDPSFLLWIVQQSKLALTPPRMKRGVGSPQASDQDRPRTFDEDSDGENNPFTAQSAQISEGQPLYAAGLVLDFWCAAAEFFSLNCDSTETHKKDVPKAKPEADTNGLKKISPSSASSSSNSLSSSSAECNETRRKPQIPPLRSVEEAEKAEETVDTAGWEGFMRQLDFLLCPFEGLVLNWLVAGEVFDYAGVKSKVLHLVLAVLTLPDSPLISCPLTLSTYARVHYLSIVQMYYDPALNSRTQNTLLCVLHLKCMTYFSALGGSVSRALLDKLGVAGVLADELTVVLPESPVKCVSEAPAAMPQFEEAAALLCELGEVLEEEEESELPDDNLCKTSMVMSVTDTPPLAFIALGSPDEDVLLETMITVHSYTDQGIEDRSFELHSNPSVTPPRELLNPDVSSINAEFPVSEGTMSPAGSPPTAQAAFEKIRNAMAPPLQLSPEPEQPLIGGTPAPPKALVPMELHTAASVPNIKTELLKTISSTGIPRRSTEKPTPVKRPIMKPVIPSLRLGKAQPSLYGVADAPIGDVLQPSPQPASPLVGVSVVRSVIEMSDELSFSNSGNPPKPVIPTLKFGDRTPSAHWGTREASVAGVLSSVPNQPILSEDYAIPEKSTRTESTCDEPVALMVLPPSTNDLYEAKPKISATSPDTTCAAEPRVSMTPAERPLDKNISLHAWFVTTLLFTIVDSSANASLNVLLLTKAGNGLTEYCKVLFNHLNEECNSGISWEVLQILRRLPETLREVQCESLKQAAGKQHRADYHTSGALRSVTEKASVLLKLISTSMFSFDELKHGVPATSPSNSFVTPERRRLGVGAFGSVVKCHVNAAIDCAGLPAARSNPLHSESEKAGQNLTEYALKQVPASVDRILDVFSEVLAMRRVEKADAKREVLRCNERHPGDTSPSGKERKALESAAGVEAVKVVDYGFDGTSFCILMPCYTQSLKQWRTSWKDRGTRPDASTLLEIYFRVLGCVKTVHDEGVVHYDLKCDNLLLKWTSGSQYPTVALCDFGESIFEEETGRVQMRARGTECIRPPEVLSAGKDKDYGKLYEGCSITSVDIWSLGCLLYELFTGEYLFCAADFCSFFHRLCSPTEEILVEEDITKLRNCIQPISPSPRGHPADVIVEYIRMHLQRCPQKRPTIETLLRHGLEHCTNLTEKTSNSDLEAQALSSYLVLSSGGSSHALRSGSLTSLPSVPKIGMVKEAETHISRLTAQLSPACSEGTDGAVSALFDKISISGCTSIDIPLVSILAGQNTAVIVNLAAAPPAGVAEFATAQGIDIINVFDDIPATTSPPPMPVRKRPNKNIFFPGDVAQSSFGQVASPKSLPSAVQKSALKYSQAISQAIGFVAKQIISDRSSDGQARERFGGVTPCLRKLCVVGGVEKGATFYVTLLAALFAVPAYDIVQKIIQDTNTQLSGSAIVTAAHAEMNNIIHACSRISRALCLEPREPPPAPSAYLRCICGETYYSVYQETPTTPGSPSFQNLSFSRPATDDVPIDTIVVEEWFHLVSEVFAGIYGKGFPKGSCTRLASLNLFVNGNTQMNTLRIGKEQNGGLEGAAQGVVVQELVNAFPEVERGQVCVHVCQNCMSVTHVVVRMDTERPSSGSGNGLNSLLNKGRGGSGIVFVNDALQTGGLPFLQRAPHTAAPLAAAGMTSPIAAGPGISPLFGRNASFPSVASLTSPQTKVPIRDLRPMLFSML